MSVIGSDDDSDDGGGKGGRGVELACFCNLAADADVTSLRKCAGLAGDGNSCGRSGGAFTFTFADYGVNDVTICWCDVSTAANDEEDDGDDDYVRGGGSDGAEVVILFNLWLTDESLLEEKLTF